MKTVCLFGPNPLPFFMEGDPASETLETSAVDLWHAEFGVLAPHLNAPRDHGLEIPAPLQLRFDAAAIRKFADAVYLMPGWERDPILWDRFFIAEAAGKPSFESLDQIIRWRNGQSYAALHGKFCGAGVHLEGGPLKIVFVVGKYFAGEKKGEKGDVLVPDRNAIHGNILAANRVAVALWREGIGAFTPHNNTHHFELKTRISEPVYQEFDRLLLERFADALVVLPSWVHSSGGTKEAALAQTLGRPVMEAYDLQSIRNWRDGKGPVHVITTLFPQ